MKRSEFDACAAKGVKDIIELKVGFDGIVVAVDKRAPDYAFTTSALYLGLAAKVLRYGQYQANPYKTWPEIANGLPKGRIQVYGPPPSSGTRDAFVELAIEAGALTYPANKALKENDEKRFKEMVNPLRKDGWIDSGENDNAIVQTLTKTPGALGVFGWSFLEENMDKIEAALLEHCREHNMESLKTQHGTAYKRIRERYWATDWDTFNQYVREHDAIELYEKRIHQGNMKQFLEDHPGATPPINVDRKFTISVRRSK